MAKTLTTKELEIMIQLCNASLQYTITKPPEQESVQRLRTKLYDILYARQAFDLDQ